jgi:threonine aldolase
VNLFSFSGGKKTLSRIVGALFFPEEERVRRAGIAMREQGKGLQEQIRALAAATAVELEAY